MDGYFPAETAQRAESSWHFLLTGGGTKISACHRSQPGSINRRGIAAAVTWTL